MTNNNPPNTTPSEDVQRWATEGAGEGDPASSLSAIEAYMDAEVMAMGTLHSDISTLPEGTSERFHTFESPAEIEDYLAQGGLVFFDENGDPIPNPIVHIIKESDPDDADFYWYIVYIADDSKA